MSNNLDSKIKKLVYKISPKNDLWPEILKKIDKKNQSKKSRFSFFQDMRILKYACSIVSILLVLSIGYIITKEIILPGSDNSQMEGYTVEYKQFLKELSYAEKKYTKAKENLIIAIDNLDLLISPGTYNNIMSNLKIMENSITEIKKVVLEKTGDHQVHYELVYLYEYQTQQLIEINHLLSNLHGGFL